jgi:hypothetical protein
MRRALDSTSLTEYKTCPRKYYYSYVRNLRSNKPKPALEFGTHYHKAMEIHDKSIALGESKTQALHRAVRYALLAGVEYYIEVVCNCGYTYEVPNIYKVPDTDLETHTCPSCGSETNIDELPADEVKIKWREEEWLKMEKFRTRFTLVRSVVWNIFNYDSDLETIVLPNGIPAVELSFRLALPIPTPDGDNYIFCGHIDRMVNYNGQPFILDRKHSYYPFDDRKFQGYSPDNQMSGYIAAGEVLLHKVPAGVLVEGAQVIVGTTRFARGFANRATSQVNEWIKDLCYYVKRIEQDAVRDHWPMNDTACHHYGGCGFREICNKAPEIREQYIQKGFIEQIWNPLESR